MSVQAQPAGLRERGNEGFRRGATRTFGSRGQFSGYQILKSPNVPQYFFAIFVYAVFCLFVVFGDSKIFSAGRLIASSGKDFYAEVSKECGRLIGCGR